MTPPTSIDPTVNLSFNIPFSSTLAGPDVEDVLHASPAALERWTFPGGTPEGTSVHQLPVHTNNVEGLRRLCRQITESSAGRIEASLTSSEPKAVPSLQRRPNGLTTNVCVTGDGETVRKMRAKILNETPIMLVRGRIFFSPSHREPRVSGRFTRESNPVLANVGPLTSDVRPSMSTCI